MAPFGIAIHGGAGDPGLVLGAYGEDATHGRLQDALAAGYNVLERDGGSVEAAMAAVQVLEDAEMFNAGRGSVFGSDGACELDASIMDGATLAAGAVAGLRHIRNPICLAHDVMRRSNHVFLIGSGAEKFAADLGYEVVPNDYFQTKLRRRQWEDSRKNPTVNPAKGYYGTVGCVALDRAGNLAAGTSTGGNSNKKWGRVGDSPIIGAGNYANNRTCGVSATGYGEFFIRTSAAYDISAQIEYGRRSLGASVQCTLEKIGWLGGSGGIIAVSPDGRVAIRLNAGAMWHGYKFSDGRIGAGLLQKPELDLG